MCSLNKVVFVICLAIIFSNVVFSQNIDLSNAENIYYVENGINSLDFSESLFSIIDKEGLLTVFDGEGKQIFQKEIDKPLEAYLSDAGNRVLVSSYIGPGPIANIHCFDESGNLLWSEIGFQIKYKISENEAYAIPVRTSQAHGTNRFNILDMSTGEFTEPQFDIDYVLFQAEFLNDDQVVLLFQTSKRSENRQYSVPEDLFLLLYTISNGTVENKINLSAGRDFYSLHQDYHLDGIQVTKPNNLITVRALLDFGLRSRGDKIPEAATVLTQEGEILMEYVTENRITDATTFGNKVVLKEWIFGENTHKYVFINTEELSTSEIVFEETLLKNSSKNFKVYRVDGQILFTHMMPDYVFNKVSNIEKTAIGTIDFPIERLDGKKNGIVKVSDNLVIIEDRNIQIQKQTP